MDGQEADVSVAVWAVEAQDEFDSIAVEGCVFDLGLDQRPREQVVHDALAVELFKVGEVASSDSLPDEIHSGNPIVDKCEQLPFILRNLPFSGICIVLT